ncbi:hypothetical protein CERSUDRAFT_94643 [Gelatoporia subvermispora B]|uniref:BTB domain-containing protein n=1 Tax=Ceriporiopsis subvermispora (strain B) TaxID=914234 RepID=M2RFP6_CERS8|nr:hypothetical protein CERSUDRAFT_94643 [Gelatoporia subvermispora B]
MTNRLDAETRSGSPLLATVISHPFDDTDADLVLRCVDSVEFRVYKVILAKASTVFYDMFSLAAPRPAAPYEEDNPPFKNDVPIIDVSEDGRTMDMMLRFCYPMEDPELSQFEDTERMLEVGTKYDIDIVVKRAKNTLAIIAEHDALRVFSLGVRLGLRDVGLMAARKSLSQPMWSMEPPFPPDLKHIPAITFCQLFNYRQRCGETAAALCSECGWIEDASILVICSTCSPSRTFRVQNGVKLPTSKWFTAYMDRAAMALRDRPCGRAALDPYMLEHTLHIASQCNMCGSCALVSLSKLSRRLAEEVEKAMDRVPLQIDF